SLHTFVNFSGASRVFALIHKLVELLDVDSIREFWIQLVVAISIDDEVLFQWLITVKSFADVRNRGMKITLDYLQVGFTPEGVDDCVLGSAAVPSGRDEAQNVAATTRGPCVRRQWSRELARDLDRSQ